MNFDFSVIPSATLAMMMLALGMELSIDDFHRLLSKPRAAFLGVVGQLVILPCVAFGLVLSLPFAMTTSVGLVLLAACPGGATSNMFSRYAGGDVALSISLTAVSSICAPITVPLIVSLGLSLIAGTGSAIHVSMFEMVVTLISTTAAPVIIGMIIFHRYPVAAAKFRGKLLGCATVILVLLVIGLFVNTARIQQDVMGMFFRSATAVALLITICTLFTTLGCRWIALSSSQSRTLVLEVGIQNINLALVVALNFLKEPDYLGPTIVFLPFMFLLGGTVIFWGRRVSH